jgi:hypothetical protein
MKKITLIFFIITRLSAQYNLVPNYSFEDTANCPQTQNSVGWSAPPWVSPTWNTPDYFHSCNSGVGWGNYVSTPQNFTGFQNPKTGLAYCGVSSYSGGDSREYIETNLLDTLKAEKSYCVKFFISLSDSSKFSSDDFGLHLRPTFYQNFSDGLVLPFIPQITYNGPILNDSVNWTEIKGEFFAQGNEYYIIIGSFSPDSQINTDTNSTKPDYWAYYYIDDVSVYEQAEAVCGPDTFICPGDSVQIGIVGRSDLFYSWQPATGLSNPNVSNPYVYSNGSTTYTLTVTDTNSLACTTVFSDSVKVWVSCVGIKENKIFDNKYLSVYPNPANEFLYLEKIIETEGVFRLYDVLGNDVSKSFVSNKNSIISLDMSKYESGIYFYSYSIKGEIVQSGKLILSH